MKAHTWKRVWVAFITVVFTLLGLASPALALNGHPVEGEHYKIVRGTNPGSTYLKVTAGVNINTPLLAEALRTTPHDIRADNPTKTIALCHVQGDGYRMGTGIDSPAKRASNAVWQTCPDPKAQYVYIIPGEVIEITGVKHLSFDDEQKVLAEIKACADQACVMSRARALGAKVAADMAPANPPAAEVAPQVSVPASPSGQPANTSVLEGRIQALESERDDLGKKFRAAAIESSIANTRSLFFGGLFLFALVASVGLLRSRTIVSRKLASVRAANISLSDSLVNAKSDRTKALDTQRKKFVDEQVHAEESVIEKDRLLKVRDAELATVRANIETLRTLLNSRETEARQIRQRFVQFMSDLHVNLRGAPLHVADSSDLAAETHGTLEYVKARNEDLRKAVTRLGQVVDDQGPETQVRPFDLIRLHEITELLTVSSNEMEPFCDGRVTSITGRVKQCCSD
ncbi:MAG TPA: hypothetical protein VN397_03415, partial [Candidatus Methylomirabilis sp.]|nr:hypothetical protein [Candidatus Methylomirabilis sp.]